MHVKVFDMEINLLLPFFLSGGMINACESTREIPNCTSVWTHQDKLEAQCDQVYRRVAILKVLYVLLHFVISETVIVNSFLRTSFIQICMDVLFDKIYAENLNA